MMRLQMNWGMIISHLVDAKAKHFDDDVEAALAKQGHTDLLHLQQMKEMRDILRGAHWTLDVLSGQAARK